MQDRRLIQSRGLIESQVSTSGAIGGEDFGAAGAAQNTGSQGAKTDVEFHGDEVFIIGVVG